MAHRYIFIIIFLAMPAFAGESIVGNWLFYKMIYKGQLVDPVNPNLVMTLNLRADGVNSLKWLRTDEDGFCEREALYSYNSSVNSLHQRVTWVHPGNRGDCAKDPDMQMNSETWSPLELKNNQLLLKLPLGDDDVVMVWKRTN